MKLVKSYLAFQGNSMCGRVNHIIAWKRDVQCSLLEIIFVEEVVYVYVRAVHILQVSNISGPGERF